MSILPSPSPVSDRQFSQILAAVEPLSPTERSAFLDTLAHRLQGVREFGDGSLYRLAREILRQIWTPPEVERTAEHRRRKVGSAIA
jgi:hypothetical protein